ncbi:MAG: thioredoxin domain-containing protein [Gemmatimonadaceae bacterium]|nr:thioredoxin domain-containing protein [Gemmatimonadaceae bacterium]
MPTRLENTASVVLTVAAVTIAVAIVKREFWSSPSPICESTEPAPPTQLADWEELVEKGVFVGNPGAPVTVVEFSDLECPFCKKFHETLSAARTRYGDSLAFVHVYFPLPMHRFARPAARAAECARGQGRFYEFVSAVFAKQDSLGLRSWVDYAIDAKVGDTVTFRRCVADTVRLPLVEAGVAAAQQHSVRVTPTVIVNGWRFSRAPDDSLLAQTVETILAGLQPLRRDKP